MGKMDEMILAVTREDLFGKDDVNSFQGFKSNDVDVLSKIPYVEKRRGDLEEDATYKQLISYVIIRAKAENKILAYKRIGGGDKRLHLSSSIGVGGHANKVENADTMDNIMVENALRELNEEVTVKGSSKMELNHIGFINDDSNEVGRVHVGVVYEFTVDSMENVTVAETDTLEITWLSVEELQKDDTLENWSKILVPYLYERVIVTEQPKELSADVQEALKKLGELTEVFDKYAQEAVRRHSLGLLPQKEREDISMMIDVVIDKLMQLASEDIKH